MATWLVPFSDLTLEQREAVELSPAEHRLILGPPGSGKTQVLVHRARYLCDLWKVRPERFRVFVYTNVLKEYIRSGMETLGLEEASVSTFASWCSEYYEQNISKRKPWNDVEQRPNFDRIRTAVHEHLVSGSDRARARVPTLFPAGGQPFDFVLVDEAQDLDGSSFDILKLIARHVTVCIDPNQQIYDQGTDEADALKRLGLRRRNKMLLGAYRCSPYIFNLASFLLKDSTERELFMRQARIPQSEKEKPLLFLAADFDEEKKRLIDVVKTRLSRNERIGILFPHKRLVYGFAHGFEEAGLEIETPHNLDMASEKPKLIPYHSAKGLTFDSVLLPMLNTRYFERTTPARVQRLLFVAITRATKWVYLSGNETYLIDVVKGLQSAAGTEHLTVQRGLPEAEKGNSPPKRSRRNGAKSKEDDDLLSLF